MLLILNGTPKHNDLAEARCAVAFYNKIAENFTSVFGEEEYNSYWKCREQIEDVIATLNDVLHSPTGLMTLEAPECWRCGNTSMPMTAQHIEFIHRTVFSQHDSSLTRHRCDGWGCRTCGFFIGVDDGKVVF